MPSLRRAASVLALLLACLVGGQSLDVVPCGDADGTEACAERAPAPVDADCLCHLTFAPTTAPVPQLAPEATGRVLPDGPSAAPLAGVAPPLVRPPIG